MRIVQLIILEILIKGKYWDKDREREWEGGRIESNYDQIEL